MPRSNHVPESNRVANAPRAPRAPRLSLEALEDRCVRSGGLSLSHIAIFLPASASSSEIGGLDIDTAAMLLRVLTTNAHFDAAAAATNEVGVETDPVEVADDDDVAAVILPMAPIAVFDTSLLPLASGSLVNLADDHAAIPDGDPLLLPSDLLAAIGVSLADSSPLALVPAHDDLQCWLEELLANTPAQGLFAREFNEDPVCLILVVAPAGPPSLDDFPAGPSLIVPPPLLLDGPMEVAEADFAALPVFASMLVENAIGSDLVGNLPDGAGISLIDSVTVSPNYVEGNGNDSSVAELLESPPAIELDDPVVLEDDASEYAHADPQPSNANYSHGTYASGGHKYYGHGGYAASHHAYSDFTHSAQSPDTLEGEAITAEPFNGYWQAMEAATGAGYSVSDHASADYSSSGYSSSGYSEANWTTDQCPWMMAVQDRNLPSNGTTLALAVAPNLNPTSLAAYGQDQVIAALLRSQASTGANAVWAASIVTAGRSIRSGSDGAVDVETAVSVRAVTMTTSESVLVAASARVTTGGAGQAGGGEVDAALAKGAVAARGIVSTAHRAEARSGPRLAADSDDAFDSWQDLAIIACDTEAISADPNVDPALVDAVFETLPTASASGITPTLAASGAALVVAAATGLRQKSRRRRALRALVKEWIQQGLSVARLATMESQRSGNSRISHGTSRFSGHHSSSNWIRVHESTREATEIVSLPDADSEVA